MTDGLFEGEEAVLHVIERIVAPLGLRVDESSPWVDARLSDGSRVHAIIPPLSLCGPTLNIRKFSPVPFTPEELLARGALGPRALSFLAACVRGRANVIVSGGTSLIAINAPFRGCRGNRSSGSKVDVDHEVPDLVICPDRNPPVLRSWSSATA